MYSNKILILLSTYNGEKYLAEQLDSLFKQTHKEFKIIVRDDGSTDGTLDILESYDLEMMPFSKNLGAKQSFSLLLDYALKNNDSDYIMFCDQDDVWKEDKIEKTLSKMMKIENGSNQAILVHTDLVVVDEKLHVLDNSFWNYQNLHAQNKLFSDFIVQNNITGCTVMINRKLATLALPIPSESIMHDWWLGMVASQFGKIDYIQEPTILYRQHGANDTGAKRFDVKFLIQNAKTIFKNHKQGLAKYTAQADKFLEVYHDKLDADTIVMIKDFVYIKEKYWWQRVMILKRYRLFKQDFWRNVGLLFSV